jgi:hypothetical protein
MSYLKNCFGVSYWPFIESNIHANGVLKGSLQGKLCHKVTLFTRYIYPHSDATGVSKPLLPSEFSKASLEITHWVNRSKEPIYASRNFLAVNILLRGIWAKPSIS